MINPKHIFLNIAYKVMSFYWALSKSVSVGVRVIVQKDGKVLLVKHSYRKGYFLPGEGVGRTENFNDAAAREVREETNLKISDVLLINVYRNFIEKKSNCVLIYKADKIENPDDLKVDGVEIIDYLWTDPKSPHPEASFYTKEILSAL